MINLRIGLVALGTLLIALTGGPSLTPIFAAGGGGGGGGGGPGGEDIMNPKPPASQSAPSTRSTHRSKKANKQSSLSDPAFIQGYRTAYATITTTTIMLRRSSNSGRSATMITRTSPI